MSKQISFPDGFKWGVATSSYQIEGAWQADGKGESIWDRFSHTPGKIEDASTGDVACDHYNLWPQDIALMKEIGIDTYRFSIAWPRILPSGRGEINQAGIDFYSRLVDALLENGIMPNATLYHWDLPQALDDLGGWPDRMIVDAFVEYADIMTKALGDRVKMWATFNEPFVSAMLGYLIGVHAPGHQDPEMAVAAAHHTLLAHGSAVPVMRANVPNAKVGIVLNLAANTPASQSYADLDAARRQDGFINRWYLDPLAGRGYPADVVADFDADMTVVKPGDLETIAAPIDFLGINYYTRHVHRVENADKPQVEFESDERTDMGWEVYPQGLYELLVRVQYTYEFPEIYITENGAAYATGPDESGEVNDEERLSYLARHFAQAQRAIDAGVNLKGYYVWSFLDNFEWAFGYAKRFGIVYVDYETQERTLKNSAKWYKQVIANNGFEFDAA